MKQDSSYTFTGTNVHSVDVVVVLSTTMTMRLEIVNNIAAITMTTYFLVAGATIPMTATGSPGPWPLFSGPMRCPGGGMPRAGSGTSPGTSSFVPFPRAP